MDAVVVPSLTSVRRAEADRTEINQKIKLLRNPVVKKPKDTPTLSLDTIRERLRDIGYDPYPIDLEKEVLDATVTREFMSHTYGGNPQVMYPTIGKKFLDKTGMKYFMYPNLSYNPHCPEVPGAPGLLFHVDCPGYTDDEADDEEASGDEASGDEASGDEASGDEASGDGANDEDSEGGERSHTRRRTELEVAGEDDEDSEDDKKKGTDEEEEDDFESWILISRLGSGIWQYQGQYVEAPAPRLTHHEWMQQSSKVKNVWIEGISECNWGRSIRAAVALRKELGRKPTLKEKKAALSDKANRFLTVTQKDIGNAFDRGELAIYLSTMKCVGYNVDFQRDLAEKMPLFVPAPKAPRAKKKRVSKPKGKQKDKNKTNVSAPRSRKRKREETDLGNDFDSDAADDEHDVHMLYRPRGTRSRPIVL
ncbi:hypothetical protein B0H15DRAFT_944468 [Mycena belliarum]|uniref:DUF6697 domain-containing protein n=1 Tax=Mycena belliarum TaxID=1033014 RepID=A0AAD6UEQ7_9AGAR|nr:hypothetical protein B0H15DRAFT_944468 [Mycena belliae]